MLRFESTPNLAVLSRVGILDTMATRADNPIGFVLAFNLEPKV